MFKFVCEQCNYKTNIKSNYTKHLYSWKHKIKNKSFQILDIILPFPSKENDIEKKEINEENMDFFKMENSVIIDANKKKYGEKTAQ